ncbi:mandelate racemase/muconate lactonizing enzyme family protein [Falsiroseomonas sp.]|uniref:mandelate racemase/muconate lactonizing enzyme family protein n=1 Tax=Falsiroseomonas sp. TaxID=2870721 RepID=UPI003563E15C
MPPAMPATIHIHGPRITAAELLDDRIVLRAGSGENGACALPPDAAAAALRLARDLVNTPALAQMPEGALRHWLSLDGVERAAFGAVLAARGALRDALGAPPLPGGPMAPPPLLENDEPATQDPVAACLDPARTLLVADARTGGPEGLRDLAALARAFDVRLALRPDPGEAGGTARLAAHIGAAVASPFPSPTITTGSDALAVREVRLHRIALPLRDLYVSSMYITDRQARTLVELRTAGGTVGWGETHGAIAPLVATMARGWIGQDIGSGRAALRRRFARIGFENRQGRDGMAAFAGLDLAAWDAAARHDGLSLRTALGDHVEGGSVPIACPLPAAVPGRMLNRAELAAHMADAGNAARVADLAGGIAARWGVTAFKYKSAGNAAWDLAALAALRATLGPAARLRFDPNAAYPVEEARRLCISLEPLSLEFLEDPTDGLEGMARLAHHVTTPLATNMCILSPEHLAAAARRPGLGIVLSDLFYWGGVAALRDMVAVARLLGLTPALHSFYETGLCTAANAQMALALRLDDPHPVDCGWPLLAEDIVAPDAFAIADGRLTPPTGPGLGLTPDPARLAALATAEPIVVC